MTVRPVLRCRGAGTRLEPIRPAVEGVRVMLAPKLRSALSVAAMSALFTGARPVPTDAADPATQPGIVKSEFIYDTASFPKCHASTISESDGRLVAAWFGGTDEGRPDVGIWVAGHDGKAWSKPVEVANGV